MWWYDSGPGWFGWLVMTLAMLAFWGAIVFGAVAAYRALRRDRERTMAAAASSTSVTLPTSASGHSPAGSGRVTNA